MSESEITPPQSVTNVCWTCGVSVSELSRYTTDLLKAEKDKLIKELEPDRRLYAVLIERCFSRAIEIAKGALSV